VKTHMTRTEENVMRKHTDKDSPCPYILHLWWGLSHLAAKGQATGDLRRKSGSVHEQPVHHGWGPHRRHTKRLWGWDEGRHHTSSHCTVWACTQTIRDSKLSPEETMTFIHISELPWRHL
jgi:hypothetical protein